jgi:hypothetical protein
MKGYYVRDRALFSPSGLCGLPGYLGSPFWGKAGRACFTTLKTATPAKRNGGRVFVRVVNWLWRFILDFAAGNVDHELSELGGIAWTFEAFVWHHANIRHRPSVFQRTRELPYSKEPTTTGCPVLVNTSFNVRGEPIVSTPEDAFRCFMGTDIERLVIGHCFLVKGAQSHALVVDYKNNFELD